MDELKKSYPNVEGVIIERLPYRECLKIKRACHIVFDHMRGWFGIASLESLSQGKPVIAGLDRWNQDCIMEFTGTDSLPWLFAWNQTELEKALARLICDFDFRNTAGRSSRCFMESYWTEQHVLEILWTVYKSL